MMSARLVQGYWYTAVQMGTCVLELSRDAGVDEKYKSTMG